MLKVIKHVVSVFAEVPKLELAGGVFFLALVYALTHFSIAIFG
jgi:hypothetical protein